MEETIVCKLCLEPVSNFICIDCLLGHIQYWLVLTHHEELYPQVIQAHNKMKAFLSAEEKVSCFICKKPMLAISCPCCYLYEMYIMIKNIDLELANEFEKQFNFDFAFHHGYSQLTLWESIHNQAPSLRNFKAVVIIDREPRTDLNFCDNCGQPSELIEVNGMLVCETCKESGD